MVRRHVFAHKVPNRVADQKANTGIDYAIWVQNSDIGNEELAVLLGIDVKYVKRMRKLDWMPGKAVRDRIDNLILTRRE
ncbi:hypothetical protein [Streptococcus suis]|uniref:hypothetical protein n=1 Tax=Streptococcus suis TaxID=1307 RepID=UPI001ABE5105|nr:hypothetical protein [Streptococcus suis]